VSHFYLYHRVAMGIKSDAVHKRVRITARFDFLVVSYQV
jgi:hypothetical protein